VRNPDRGTTAALAAPPNSAEHVRQIRVPSQWLCSSSCWFRYVAEASGGVRQPGHHAHARDIRQGQRPLDQWLVGRFGVTQPARVSRAHTAPTLSGRQREPIASRSRASRRRHHEACAASLTTSFRRAADTSDRRAGPRAVPLLEHLDKQARALDNHVERGSSSTAATCRRHRRHRVEKRAGKPSRYARRPATSRSARPPVAGLQGMQRRERRPPHTPDALP